MKRAASWLATIAVATIAVATGCYQLEATPEEAVTGANRCHTDGDCSQSTCLASGLCSVPTTEFAALLLELRPPATQERFQGALTYYPLQLNARAQAENVVTIRYPRAVRGDIGLALGAADCRPSPVVVTFVPVEARLGIDTPRYSTISQVGTAIVDKKHVDTHRYSLSGIPEGTYDVYLEDANLVDNSARPQCAVAPQSIRGLTIQSQAGASKFVGNLVQTSVRSLRVVVPSASPFGGWSVDVIHRVTGELLSSRALLPATTDGPVDVTLRLSEGTGDRTSVELLRLSPPVGEVAPTITLVLAGLEVFERGEALVPALGSLATPVSYQTWVWRSSRGGGVKGTVQFTALGLDALPPGVNATFERRAPIGTGGLVQATLPPGRYLARVFPEANPEPESQVTLALHEAEVTVWTPLEGPDGPGTSQAGHVIVVPESSTLRGRVTFAGQAPPPGTQVAALGSRVPHTSVGVSRPAAALPPSIELVRGTSYSLSGLWCRGCRADAPGAAYDLFVRPPQSSGLPWIVSVGERVNGQVVELPEFRIGLPRVATGVLNVTTNGTSVPLPRFTVRALALLDKQGRPLEDIGYACDELSAANAAIAPCVAGVLEVAATRTNDDGSFTLLLPQSLRRGEALDAGL